MAINLINHATSAGATQSHACEILGIDSRTLRRWKKNADEPEQLCDQRKTSALDRVPANKLTEQERAQILEVCNEPEYQNLPPSQIVPMLADKGQYIASESSFFRILKAAQQLNRRGKAEKPKNSIKPKGFKATQPNQVYSWDITYLATTLKGTFYYLYLIEDIFSRKIVGWEIHTSESAEYASDLIKKTCLAEGIYKEGLVLHSDNGSPMKGATMLATLQKLGVVPSFSRPSVSDDNPYSESLFRTMKYWPTFPSKPFESLQEAQQWVNTFVQYYNNEHHHSAIHFVTPNQRHTGEDHTILAHRKAVYDEAKQRHPERWSGQIRNWNRIDEVWLNPPKEMRSENQKHSTNA